MRPDVIHRLFTQIVGAMIHCHGKNVCHRDLKPENLIVDDKVNIKV